jgi:hypothetical protein
MVLSSGTDLVTVNPAFISTSWVASNSPATEGGYQTLTATITGGTSSYTYNFLVYNSVGLITNALYTTSSTTNSFTFLQDSAFGGGTFTANLFVTDSAYSPQTVSNTLTYQTAACTTSLSALLVDFGSISPKSSVATNNAIIDTNGGSTNAYLWVFSGNWLLTSNGANGFGVSNTSWAASSGVSYALANKLGVTAVNTGLLVPSSSGSNTVYFGLNIPAAATAATYNQIITIENSC